MQQGQIGMFDNPEQAKRPCDYRFLRYIGQEVKRWRTGEIRNIIGIGPYYTYLDDGTVATPYDILPIIAENGGLNHDG